MSDASTHTGVEEEAMTTGDRYRLFAVERRRVLLEALDERGATTLTDLAAAVATAEDDGGTADDDTAAADGDSGTETAAIRLHHVDLPMLADAGVVDYDPETKRVVPDRSRLDELSP